MPRHPERLRVTGHPSQVIVLDDHLFFLFTQVVGHRDSVIGQRLQHLDISASKWRVLGTLQSRNMLMMSELAEMTAIDRTTLTRMLNQMQGNGLVLRTPDVDDKRAIMVTLTRRGQNLFLKANQIVEQINDEITQDISDAEIPKLRELMQRLHRRTLSLLSSQG